MFERYTEKARRVIFFARYEASQFGSPYIETEHLLLGLLREDKALPNAAKAGTETASVAQFPAKMGSLGIATLYRAVTGKTVPKNVDTGTALVTKANAAKFG